jgi:hypothetical protein
MRLIQRRLDQRANDIDITLPPLRALAARLAMVEKAPPVPSDLRRGSLLTLQRGAAPLLRASQVLALVSRGERLAESLRKGPPNARPSRTELTSWRRQASLMVAYYRVLDPEWLAGYESALTGRDKRLISAMW